MGFDEKLFAFGLRLFKRFNSDPKPPHYEQRVDLKDIAPRLNIIARSLCGEAIEILEAERMGGYSGVHFYYPKSLCPFDSKKLNELIYIQRTLFYSSARQLGLCLPPGEISDLEKKIYSCLALYQINQHIAVEFPGITKVTETLYAYTQKELQALPADDKRTQNGILAHWISDILSRDYSTSPWKSVLCTTHKSPVSFWKFAEAIYKQHMVHLPPGPPLADEAFILWGYLMSPPATDRNLNPLTEGGVDTESLPTGTEIQGKNREDLVEVHLEDKKNEANPVMHSFEKMETLEEYQGGMRTVDGDDDLKDHAEALEELNIREVIRSRERTSSLYKADIRLNASAPDLLTVDESSARKKDIRHYPEWDFKNRVYRENWCRLEIERSQSQAADFQLGEGYLREKREILKLFENVRHQPLWKKRQSDGSEIDIDALVNWHANIRSGHSSEDRFYLRSSKHKKDWQCLLLIDSSLSTDSWVANERVLDVIKNSVCLIADALPAEADCISVAAFHSNTRHQCVYQELKGFRDSWSHLKKALTVLEPSGYTRIGPALRHGLELHKSSSARHKFIILLSDGKASDYDHYEGQYGMEDIKQALREARRQDVHIKCLAIEENAKFYLPQMFGSANIHILSNPHKLPQALSSLLLPLL